MFDKEPDIYHMGVDIAGMRPHVETVEAESNQPRSQCLTATGCWNMASVGWKTASNSNSGWSSGE